MDDVTIKYGSGNLHLKKSASLIAVKPKPGTDQQTLRALSPQAVPPVDQQPMLGGFRLLSVEAATDVADTSGLENTLDALRMSGAIEAGTHVYETSGDQIPFVPTGQLYIEFNQDATDEEMQELLDVHRLELVEARGARRFIAQVTPGSENPIKTAAALQESPLIRVAEPDLATPGIVKALALPADTLLQNQWHLKNTGNHRGTTIGFKRGADARVAEAWKYAQTLGNPMVVVAVIDDGFDLQHPDLSGQDKIVAPMDFTRNTPEPLPEVANGDWHGTACAGVAVGNANGEGILGAAPHCRLMPVRWGRDLSDREIENWFGWVTEQGAWVVSCSWGAAANVFRLSTRASEAIRRCAKEGRAGLGCVVCFAAGNDNHDVNDPAAGYHDGFAVHPDVIAVAACNSRDEKSDYSNYGKEISVCASSSGAGGWGITTSDVMGRFIQGGVWRYAGYSPGAYTNDFGGTSSACPLVAGICALLLTIRPAMTARQVKELIECTARRVGDLTTYNDGHSPYHGYGCVDALAAAKKLIPRQS